MFLVKPHSREVKHRVEQTKGMIRNLTEEIQYKRNNKEMVQYGANLLPQEFFQCNPLHVFLEVNSIVFKGFVCTCS